MNNINPVCWFEIYVNDLDRAKKFYSEVLGQNFTNVDMPDDGSKGDMQMAFFSGSESPEAPNANGALIKMSGVKSMGQATLSTIVYFGCADCSVEESRVVAAGGQVHKSKFSIGEYGFCAICLDTEGNTFGLYSMQ